MSNIIYQDNYNKLIFKGTLVILQSKKKLYNDKYFNSLDEARTYMLNFGITI